MNAGRPATGLCPSNTPTASVPSAAIGLPSWANAGLPRYVVSRRTAGSPLPTSLTYVSTPWRQVSIDTDRVPPPAQPVQSTARQVNARNVTIDCRPGRATGLPLVIDRPIARRLHSVSGLDGIGVIVI